MHTVSEMKAALKAKGVKGCSGMKKAELETACRKMLPVPHPSGSKFIQKVMSSPSYKKGAMTKAAKKHHEKPLEYAKEVLAHPEKHDLTTRRRAQFLVNIQRK
jgi:hypothetical protein